jgi:hypothetical protein
VTWSREAASKSWECSSGGIRAPTIGETIVRMFAVDNSAQILPRVIIRPQMMGGLHLTGTGGHLAVGVVLDGLLSTANSSPLRWRR